MLEVKGHIICEGCASVVQEASKLISQNPYGLRILCESCQETAQYKNATLYHNVTIFSTEDIDEQANF